MVIDLIELAVLGLVAVTLLWLVPRPASRTWAAGLLVVAVICNLGTVIVTVAAYFSPPAIYLDTEKNQLQFHRVVLSGRFLQSGGQIEQADSPVRKLFRLHAAPGSRSDFFSEDESLQRSPLVGMRRTTLLRIPRTTAAVH